MVARLVSFVLCLVLSFAGLVSLRSLFAFRPVVSAWGCAAGVSGFRAVRSVSFYDDDGRVVAVAGCGSPLLPSDLWALFVEARACGFFSFRPLV